MPRHILILSLVILGAGSGSVLAQEHGREAAVERFFRRRPLAHRYLEGDRLTRVFGTALASGNSPEGAAERFRMAHADLFGVAPDDLLPISRIVEGWNTQPMMYDPETGTYKFTLVYYAQYASGVPVFRSDLRLLVRNESGYPLVWVGSSLHDLGGFTVDRARATVSFDPVQQVDPDLTRFTPPETVVWAGVDDMSVDPVLAVTFVGEKGSPDGGPYEKWLYVVEPTTGAVLYRENLILTEDVTGSVSGLATETLAADFCAEEVSTGMPYAFVEVQGGNSAFADVMGDYVIANGGTSPVTVASPIRGLYFRVTDFAGPDEVLTQGVTPPVPADFLHNAGNTEFVRAQVNAYIHANVVRDFTLIYNPAYPSVSTQTDFAVNVNRVDGFCPGNAWWSGDAINFCLAFAGAPNTGYSSVVYHEYGHHLVGMAGSGQDQYGEGMSDVLAMLIADDPILGWGFDGVNCNAGLRNADNNMQYPCSGESHFCGTLLSGCAWSTRQELIQTNPATYLDILSNLAINSILLHSGELITPQITIDFLILDDDDADINDGTPHVLEICAGFGAHNMDCPDLAFSPIAFEYPAGVPASTGSGMETTIPVNVVPLTGTPVSGTGQLHYSLDEAPFVTAAMTEPAPNEYEAVLPFANCGGTFRWYVSADEAIEGTITDPLGAPTVLNVTTVGRKAPVFADDFEGDLGWSIGDTGDNATAGLWDRADPEGTAAQPEDDRTPGLWNRACWVTHSVAGAGPDANDVDAGRTTLLSPILDLSGAGDLAVVSYWRWYSNDTGGAPNSDVFAVDISNDGGGNWVNVETVGPSGPDTSGGWVFHKFTVNDFVLPTNQIRLRFIASDEGADSTIEAAIDDFDASIFQCDGASPSPNPMAWEAPPAPDTTTQISMTAAPAADVDNPPVEYFFDALSGGGANDSGWQSLRTYTDGGLNPNTLYAYRLRARDSATPVRNETADSVYTEVVTATHIETPTAVLLGNDCSPNPCNVTTTSIEMQADGTFSAYWLDQTAFFFDCNDAACNTGIGEWLPWPFNPTQPQPTDVATDLLPGTYYTFRVKARNRLAIETPDWSPLAGKATLALTPGAPILNSATATTMQVNVNPNGNPSNTAEFAIQCVGTNPPDPLWDGMYIDASANPGASETWQTDADWSVVVVQDLLVATEYTFRVKARNEVDHVETAFGPDASLTTGIPGGCGTKPGDMDGDDDVDGDDVAGFVRVKLGAGELFDLAACADYGSGTIEGDVRAFVRDLLGGRRIITDPTHSDNPV